MTRAAAPDPCTLLTVERHNAAWARGDVAAVLALYHPDMQWVDHFAGTRYQGAALHQHIRTTLERSALELLRYQDRVRVDGDTAFLRYEETVRRPGGAALMRYSACDWVRVQDGLIVEIHEYALPMAPRPPSRQSTTTQTGQDAKTDTTADATPSHAASKIGLSPRALGFLLNDLAEYFMHGQAYLQAGLSLQQVATATGYTRNQISYALNQGLGLSFYRYLGELRVRHLLQHGPPPRCRDMEELAQALGFRSLSALYSNFRRVAGQTPAQWWAQHTRPGALTPSPAA